MRLGQSARLLAGLAVVALLATTARADEAALGKPLNRVRFECNAWFDEAALRQRLPLQRGEPLTSAQLAGTRTVIEQTGIFSDIDIAPEVENGEAVVIIRLVRRPLLTAVRVSGYSAMGWRDVNRFLRLRTGTFYDHDVLRAARRRLVERYRQFGYPDAHVRSTVRKRPGEVELDIEISEGEPQRVRVVAVTGTTGVPAGELEFALRDLLGQPHRREMVRTGERTLMAVLRRAGYFEASVDGSWEERSPREGDLRFEIDAGPRTEIEVVGAQQVSASRLLDVMDLSTRLVVTDGTWREMARRMVAVYRGNGFYRATVKVTLREGDPHHVRFTVDEGRHFAIRRLRFVGNQGIPSSTLQAQMNTQPQRLAPWPRSGAFVRETFDEDLRRLWFFYREQGFAEAQIIDAPVTVDDETGALDVAVVIEEGPRTIVALVEPPDLSGLPPQTLEYQLKPDQPLKPAELDADTAAITAALRRDGYGAATVAPEVERHRVGTDDYATVRWAITRGQRRTIGGVLVQGNVETRDEIIEREIPFAVGDPLNPEALQAGQDAIFQLGTYRSVSVRPLSDTDAAPTVGVEVQPRPPGSLQWGGGYNTRDGFTLNGEVGYDNLGRRARRISLRGQASVLPNDVSQSQYVAALAYREPQFLRSRWQWNAELVGQRSTRNIDQYSVHRAALGNGLSRQLLPRLQFAGDLQVEYADVFDLQPKSFQGEDEGPSWTTAISPSLLYDGRDDPFAPTRGVFDTARFRYALPGISSVQFGKLNLQHSQAWPVASWLSLVASGRVAFGRVFSGAEVLPIRERYFIGGATTVRGYSENSLGPTGCRNPDELTNCPSNDRAVLGGDTAIIGNFEARVPVWGALSIATFLDVGGNFITQCDGACQQAHGVFDNTFTWTNFRKGAGPGLRYMTPVGPISLDYGFKIDRRAGESIGEVHFSISGTF
ncbi:MAG TPA: POTRA domain-containing protein [Candidatus Dormibacteraeota bacterium]|nr:POTRA domain-containing protein [Candidatus Dormibacteraeota bacterium]